jgi:hypothetical protein
MYSVIHSVLLNPWPLKDPARVLVVSQRQANGNLNLFSTQNFLAWKHQGGLLANIAAHVDWEYNLNAAQDQPERIAGGRMSYDLFPMLGVSPILGRYFSAQEDLAGSGNYVVLSYVLWKNRFKGNPHITGTAIQLDGEPYTVVGVMPAGFDVFGGKELLWTPLQLSANNGIGSSPTVHWLGAFIRLPDGVSLQQARAELDGIAARLHREDATSDVGYGVYLRTLNDAFTSDVRPALLMLMGCVAFVLLIACANVANLLLARGSARRRQMALRTALGASPLRVVRTLEIPLLRGRALNERDAPSTPAVAIVSESLSRKYWPGDNPIGKRLKPDFKGSSWCTVVGVVGDVRHWGADVDTEPTAYYPYTQVPDTIRPLLEANMAVAIRSTLGQSDLLHSIRATVTDVNKDVAVYDVKTMDSMVMDSGSLRRFDLSLLGAFSSLALVLAAIGVYAVIAYSVSQRTKEFGIRIALGAHSRDVLRLILKQGARLAVAGVGIGVAAAFLLRNVMGSFIYGLSDNDPVILLIVISVVFLVILLACYLPARRATKVDPMVALRND